MNRDEKRQFACKKGVFVRKILTVLVILAMMTLTGCGLFPFTLTDFLLEPESGSENPNSADTYINKDEDMLVVGFSQVGSESLWRTANTASVQGALTKENGFLLIYNNARQKQENQIKAIRSFISQQVDYIIFAPITEDGWDTVLLEAKEAGIPVILVDRKVNVPSISYFTTWIGSDTRQEGENAGLWLENYLQENGREDEEIKILVLQGTAGSSAQSGRSRGFEEVAARHENWTILEQQDADFTTSKAKEIMEAYIEKYDDFDVVVSQNDDMTFGAIEAMQKAGISMGTEGDVTVISFDATHEGLELVQEGLINVDVECNPQFGEKLAEIIQDLQNNEVVLKYNRVDERVFTQENVGDYLDDRTY